MTEMKTRLGWSHCDAPFRRESYQGRKLFPVQRIHGHLTCPAGCLFWGHAFENENEKHQFVNIFSIRNGNRLYFNLSGDGSYELLWIGPLTGGPHVSCRFLKMPMSLSLIYGYVACRI